MEEITAAPWISPNDEPKFLSYRTLTIEYVLEEFQLEYKTTRLFDQVEPVTPSSWLVGLLKKSAELTLTSEKARSEFIVAPILLSLRELSTDFNILSGITFDVEPSKGLKGICDFILTHTKPMPIIKAPILMMVEAKKNDIDDGLGQCAGEMVAARIFNQRHSNTYDIGSESIYGCITTGELWQFLRLKGNELQIDETKIYIEKVDMILGTLKTIVDFYKTSP